MGRNRIIYGLSSVTLVVASDLETGGTWSGAAEALKKGFSHVAVWRGDGEGAGNARLEEMGARPVRSSTRVLDTVRSRDADAEVPPEQRTLGI